MSTSISLKVEKIKENVMETWYFFSTLNPNVIVWDASGFYYIFPCPYRKQQDHCPSYLCNISSIKAVNAIRSNNPFLLR